MLLKLGRYMKEKYNKPMKFASAIASAASRKAAHVLGSLSEHYVNS